MFSMLGSVIHLEIPVDQVEEERDQSHEVDEDEADEDPLWDSDEIVHCAGLQCQLGAKYQQRSDKCGDYHQGDIKILHETQQPVTTQLRSCHRDDGLQQCWPLIGQLASSLASHWLTAGSWLRTSHLLVLTLVSNSFCHQGTRTDKRKIMKRKPQT